MSNVFPTDEELDYRKQAQRGNSHYDNYRKESHTKLEKTLDNLEIGDILANKFNSYQYKVLAICGNVFGLSMGDEFDLFDAWYTLTEIKKDHILKDLPEITELTLEDIAKLAGKDVSQIKIKK